MLGDGFYRTRSLEPGAPVPGEANPIRRCCFAMEIRGLGKLILGNKDFTEWMKKDKC